MLLLQSDRGLLGGERRRSNGWGFPRSSLLSFYSPSSGTSSCLGMRLGGSDETGDTRLSYSLGTLLTFTLTQPPILLEKLIPLFISILTFASEGGLFPPSPSARVPTPSLYSYFSTPCGRWIYFHLRYFTKLFPCFTLWKSDMLECRLAASLPSAMGREGKGGWQLLD